ncbi:MAG: hypothetical protein WKF94_14645 [Solirubrobacteraceae bacterium]
MKDPKHADDLTPEQRQFWDEIGFGLPRAHAGQTMAQATNFDVTSIQYGFMLYGPEPPSREAILREFARRRDEDPDEAVAADAGSPHAFPDPRQWIVERPFDSAEYLKRSAVGEDELPGYDPDAPIDPRDEQPGEFDDDDAQ